jgi:hypothetical protein
MGSGIGRNVRSPVCLPYYDDDTRVELKPDTPAIWVRRCRNGTSSSYRHPRDEFKVRSLSARIPMDFAFPDRVQSADLTLVFDNLFTINQSLWGVLNSANIGGGERIPQSTSMRAALRLTF